jgi:hypothetical protein
MQRVGHPARKILRVVSRDDECDLLPHQLLQQPLHRSALPRIEPGQRLVQQ